MPFGLSNALATFQEFINEVLKDLIATGLVLVYLDDILICYVLAQKTTCQSNFESDNDEGA